MAMPRSRLEAGAAKNKRGRTGKNACDTSSPSEITINFSDSSGAGEPSNPNQAPRLYNSFTASVKDRNGLAGILPWSQEARRAGRLGGDRHAGGRVGHSWPLR